LGTHPYIPNTEADRAAMLSAIGVATVEDLFAEIPAAARRPALNLPPALPEPDLVAHLRELAERNRDAEHLPSFLGAGAYNHYIPSVVPHLVGRAEMYTSYTPYQPEMSQGILQATYEFQSLICELTAMEVTNAGMYDGPTALAEAALMSCRLTGRRRVLVPPSLHPEYRQVLETYVTWLDVRVEPYGGPILGGAGALEVEGLTLDDDVACVVVQQPNFFGVLEDLERVAEAAHRAGALLVVVAYPIALGMIRPPGECGADIVVGEGQPLGSPVSFGGPYLGLFSCRERYVRQMPGRIVGATRDGKGRRGYVLTLQTREQHIRREKATSNICTSEALVAVAATVYLAALGPKGLRRVAELCYHRAHYAADRIAALPGYSPAFAAPFFNEFVVRCPRPPAEVNRQLLERGIIGGLDVSDQVPDGLLICVTEQNSRDQIDRLAATLEEIHAAA
jgi:glycine dehydrogenase subunit 1